MYKWTYVTITHRSGQFVVYFNGIEVLHKRHGVQHPQWADGPLYASDPWYATPRAQLAMVFFRNGV